MSAEKTKQHFAEICECLWDKAQYQEKLDKEVVSAMRKFIANFTMIAWNACIMQKTYSDVKKFLKKFTEENFGSGHSASQYVFDAAELKWREYREDTDTIASVDVKVVDGKPQAIAYLKDECPEKSSARNPFFEYLNSMGIQTQWGVNMEDCPDKTASLHNFLPFTSPFIIEDEDDDCPDYELNSHGEPPPQYEDAEPPAVIHPELLKLVKRKCPRWDGDPDCIFVDEHDNIPAKKDVKNFVRGKVIVSVMGMESCDFQADFPSLKSLFRKDTMEDAYCNNFFISFVRNIIEALVENEYIANVNNDAFIKIFSAMANDPDSPSQSFLHNMIWTAAACFLLQYECSQKEFSKILRRLSKTIRENTRVTFYDFCLGNFEDGGDEQE